MIKVWDFNKQLLREIKFPNCVDSVSFLNYGGDLIIGHDKRLSILKYTSYMGNLKV